MFKCAALLQVIEPSEMYGHDLSVPHSVHCLADGNVMMSCLGDGTNKNAKGERARLQGSSSGSVQSQTRPLSSVSWVSNATG